MTLYKLSPQADALRKDVLEFLWDNRSLSDKKKRAEILETFSLYEIPHNVIEELALYGLIFQDAFEWQRCQEYGLKSALEKIATRSIDIKRKNVKSATRKRPNGRRSEFRDAVQTVMRRARFADFTFKEFLQSAVNQSVEGLLIEHIKDNVYRIELTASGDIRDAKMLTIQDWYSGARKKIRNSTAKSKR